jgi:predicted phosphoribosyltransferase
MITSFQDRFDAGRQLGARLSSYANRGDVVVLALPRGGVPVGYEVARQLNAPLDIFLVRKLGVPGYEELAMGAIASGGARVVNEEVVDQLQIPDDVIDAATIEQQQELERREAAYRAGRQLPDLKNKTVILVDDGLATGSTMRAAVQALRLLRPKAIVVAAPVGAAETCEMLRSDADDVVCLLAPENFSAVGRWYLDFTQTSDEEVSDLLDRAAHERQVDRNAEHGRRLPASLE